jgi:hypothetical protein
VAITALVFSIWELALRLRALRNIKILKARRARSGPRWTSRGPLRAPPSIGRLEEMRHLRRYSDDDDVPQLAVDAMETLDPTLEVVQPFAACVSTEEMTLRPVVFS